MTHNSACVACSSARIQKKSSPEQSRANAKAYAKKNPERVRSRLLRWQAEFGKDQQRRWKAANVEKVIAYRTNRRTREANGGGFTGEEFCSVIVAQDFRCVYCRADLKLVRPSPDHIVPLAKGGMNCITNIQATCFPCNRRKRDKAPDVFLAELAKGV